MVNTYSFSSLASIASCTTKGWMQKVCNVTTSEESVSLMLGSAGHAAMAEWYRTKGDREAAMAHFERGYRFWAEGQILKESQEWPNVRDCMEAWFDATKFQALPYKVIPEFIEKRIEIPFIEGILDAVVLYEGHITFVDHKFTGWLSQDSIDAWRLSSQWHVYAKLLTSLGFSLPKIFLVNAVEWSRLPGGGGKDLKCKTHGIPHSQCRKYHAKYQLVDLTIDEKQNAARWVDIWILVSGFEELRTRHKDSDPWGVIHLLPMEGTFNNSCRWCEYKKWCALGRPVNNKAAWFVNREERRVK